MDAGVHRRKFVSMLIEQVQQCGWIGHNRAKPDRQNGDILHRGFQRFGMCQQIAPGWLHLSIINRANDGGKPACGHQRERLLAAANRPAIKLIQTGRISPRHNAINVMWTFRAYGPDGLEGLKNSCCHDRSNLH